MADLASRITEPPAEGAAPEAPQEVHEAQEAEVPQADGAVDSGLIENTYDVDVKLGDLQSDQNSTLYSVSTFNEMNL